MHESLKSKGIYSFLKLWGIYRVPVTPNWSTGSQEISSPFPTLRYHLLNFTEIHPISRYQFCPILLLSKLTLWLLVPVTPIPTGSSQVLFSLCLILPFSNKALFS